MEELKLAKKLSPAVDNEPMLTFRAKDNLSYDVVNNYKEMLLTAGVNPGDVQIQSLEEWLERATEWRKEHPDLCQFPTY